MRNEIKVGDETNVKEVLRKLDEDTEEGSPFGRYNEQPSTFAPAFKIEG